VSSSTLFETVADLTAERDRDSLEASLAQLLRAQLEARVVTYFRLVTIEGGARLWPVLSASADGSHRFDDAADPQRLPALEGPWARSIGERAVLRLSNRGELVCTYLFPVLAEREAVGLIEAEGVAATLSNERETAVANLLRIYRNHLALLDYGEHDTLTSLRNRRTFDGDFARLLRGTVESGPAAMPSPQVSDPALPEGSNWLAVVDVDRFKRINDEFGHLYGDEVLLLLAQMMRAQFRPTDRIYRFGGEEFVVVLTRVPASAVRIPLERLRNAVESRSFSRVGRVTVSIGYTRIGPFDEAAGAFGRADAALYHAKEHGRNQIHAWEDLVAAGHLSAASSASTEIELF
jgi:diguanylate cyclase (GGDEF)-like protein